MAAPGHGVQGRSSLHPAPHRPPWGSVAAGVLASHPSSGQQESGREWHTPLPLRRVLKSLTTAQSGLGHMAMPSDQGGWEM